MTTIPKSLAAAATDIPAGRYVSKTQIAEALGISDKTVASWIEHGKLPTVKLPYLGHIVNIDDLARLEVAAPGKPRALTDAQRADALQRLAAGESAADIAASFGCHPRTISRLAPAKRARR